MRRVSYAYYMLAGSGRTPPHKSATKLTAREAAAQGALYPIPGTIEYVVLPDDGDERPRPEQTTQPPARATAAG